jgi:hypothetical protein
MAIHLYYASQTVRLQSSAAYKIGKGIVSYGVEMSGPNRAFQCLDDAFILCLITYLKELAILAPPVFDITI